MRCKLNHQESEMITHIKGEIFANYVSDKELVSRIYKKCQISILKKLNYKVDKGLELSYFTKENNQMENKHINYI